MKIENHYKRLKENIEVLEDSIKKNVVERQSTIGFSVSASSVHMIEILLHRNRLIDESFVIKHEWFKSKNKLIEKLHFDFPNKQEILELMKIIQDKRNDFCYGPQKDEGEILDYIKKFNKLRTIFENLGIKNEK